MWNSVCVAFVRVAELRVEALRGLRTLAPSTTTFLAEELFEAERLLKYRQICLASCKDGRCPSRCRLFDTIPESECSDMQSPAPNR